MLDIGQEVVRRLDRLAACSLDGPGVTRHPFTPEHRAALDLLRDWMVRAGLLVHLDDAGTLVGRREGALTARTLLLGSHQDSVIQGGRLDGLLGIVLPIVVLERLKDAELPFAVEVLAFANEEGVRFPTALVGPRALSGSFDPSVLDLRDANGISLRGAMTDFGLAPERIAQLKRRPEDIIGYVETHIEQGPVLEDRGHAVGIVTAICGIERWQVALNGRAAHAGTVPMALRRDALAGAAEIVSEVERIAKNRTDLLGVVGELTVVPNAVNAIPGEVRLQVEWRSGDDDVRRRAAAQLGDFMTEAADRRHLKLEWRKTYEQGAATCDQRLSSRLEAAAHAAGHRTSRLLSGATHDASAMADLTEIAMLFVRCREGVSHHPDEFASAEDIDAAGQVLRNLLSRPIEAG